MEINVPDLVALVAKMYVTKLMVHAVTVLPVGKGANVLKVTFLI